MGDEKNTTYQIILKNAKQEFLQHGFKAASMRSIAAASGVTAGALYKHFPSKESIFETLVANVISLQGVSNIDFEELAAVQFQTQDFSGTRPFIKKYCLFMLEFVYEHFDEFRLLVNYSAGTKYENIRHQTIMSEVNGTKAMIRQLQKRGLDIPLLDDDTLHIMYSTAITPLFEIVEHEYSYQKALTFLDLLTDTAVFCWYKIMGKVI